MDTSMILRTTLTGLMLLIVSPGLALADAREELPRDVRLEHSLSLPDSGGARLDLELRIPYDRLVFERSSAGFTARLRIACRAERRSDRQETSLLLHDEVLVPDFAASRQRSDQFTRAFGLLLGPGEWRVETLIYGRNERAPWRHRFELEVPDLASGSVWLQGPHWTPGSGGQWTPPFFFLDPWRIPTDASCFTDGDAATIGMTCDVLNWGQGELRGEFQLSLEDRRGELVFFARRQLLLPPGRQTLTWEIPQARLGMGVYRLAGALVTAEEQRQLRGRLDVGLTAAAFDREWERTLALLRPLASADELDELAAAAAGDRPARWQAFWDRRGLAAGAPSANAALADFCERISEANVRFDAGQRDGYLSDRGQVYLERGAPDRTELVEDDRNFRQLEYWYYGGAGLVYVFEDRHGAGEFVLLRVMNG
jgi:GWxTD domain-containing protein